MAQQHQGSCVYVTVRGELGGLLSGSWNALRGKGQQDLSDMDENRKFFCLQVCLEYSKLAKGKGGKEEDGSQRGEGAQIDDAEWFEHLKDVNS